MATDKKIIPLHEIANTNITQTWNMSSFFAFGLTAKLSPKDLGLNQNFPIYWTLK
jgi:hypothetical protein